MAQNRRRVPPFPIHVVIDHPRIIALSAAGYGILWRLVCHFWQTDCAPLPESGDSLFSIARAHRPTWTHHGAEILAIFSDIAPDLAAAHRIYRQRLDNLAAMSQKGASAAGVRRLLLPGPRRLVEADSATIPAARRSSRAPAPRVEPAPGIQPEGGGFVER